MDGRDHWFKGNQSSLFTRPTALSWCRTSLLRSSLVFDEVLQYWSCQAVCTQQTFSRCETRCNGGGAHSWCYEGESATVHATPAVLFIIVLVPKRTRESLSSAKHLRPSFGHKIWRSDSWQLTRTDVLMHLKDLCVLMASHHSQCMRWTVEFWFVIVV